MESFAANHTKSDDPQTDENNSNPSNPSFLFSSSFDTTSSDAAVLSDNEVDSSALDRFNIRLRKKKLTKNWRKCIGPLMWRCKWMELRMMEIEAQGKICEKELELYEKRNLWESDKDVVESVGSRSYSYFRQYPRNKVMKRRKRRRVEDIVDFESFISQHNLFSFIENRKHDLDSLTTATDVVDTVNTSNTAYSRNQFGVHDAPSLVAMNWNTGVEGMFEKLERVQSRVQKLKTQLENIVSEHGGKYSEDLSLFATFDGQCSSNLSLNLSMGGVYPPVESISDFDIEDLGFTDTAVSIFEETIDMDAIIESSVTVLPAPDAPSSHLQILDTDQKMVANAPVDTSGVDTEKPGFNPIGATRELPSEETKLTAACSNTLLAPVPDVEVVSHSPSPLEQSFVSDYTPTNKRKRGERKISSGSWIKRYSVSDSE